MTATTTRRNVSNGTVLVSNSATQNSKCYVALRRTALAMLAVTFLVFAASPVAAVNVNVSNYSWLQLPAADVTPIIGSQTGTNTTSFGETTDIRWGDYVWLPTNAMTANATSMYYAGVRLDQARPVDSVRVQWWIPTGSFSVSQYFIDASNDGSSWSNIAIGGAVLDAQGTITNIPVTPGNYQYVRVRLEGGDYSNGGNGSYGGPGIYLVDPIGTGTVSGDQVNWANVQLGTSATNTNMPTYNSTTYNDGTLEERGGTAVWTGTVNNWNSLVPNAYTTLDLGQARLIGEAVAVWSSPYSGNYFDIEYSTDGTNFNPVTSPNLSNLSTYYHVGATQLEFDPVIATHIRMRNASGTSGYTLMNQLLLHGPTDGVLSSNPGANGTISMVGEFEVPINTLLGAIELENTGSTGSAIGIFDFEITGLDAAEFDLANFAPTVLEDGESILFDIEFTSPDLGMHTAVLTFETSVGLISFNLEASAPPAPEPASALLLACGSLVMLSRRRRRV